MSCIFCQIAAGEIESQKVYEDDDVFAFRDLEPQAPVHILIIPKKHISAVAEMNESDIEIMGKLIYTAKKLAEKELIAQSGYRLVINNGEAGGQNVFHIHLHLLGGRQMKWPPG